MLQPLLHVQAKARVHTVRRRGHRLLLHPEAAILLLPVHLQVHQAEVIQLHPGHHPEAGVVHHPEAAGHQAAVVDAGKCFLTYYSYYTF